MKVTKKIRWIIPQNEKKESFRIIAEIRHITGRRADQIGKHYRETGVIPITGAAFGTAEETGDR
jgi:hypothetical protein